MKFGLNYDDVAENPVLPLSIEQLNSNDVDIPVLAGYMSNDGLMFFTEVNQNAFDEYTKYIPDFVRILREVVNLGPEEQEELLKFVRNQCFNGQPVTRDNLDKFIRFVSNVYFTLPYKVYTDGRVDRTSTPTYIYRFSYVGNEPTFADLMMDRFLNVATHMDELAYLLYSPLCKSKNLDAPAIGTKDRSMIEFLCTTWCNFARTGNPTPCHDDVVKITWDPMTKENRCYLEIGDSIYMLPMKTDLLNIL